ncbi:MAG TPA: hypothetical protein VIT89_12155 [Solirubrobacterales bacterium]
MVSVAAACAAVPAQAEVKFSPPQTLFSGIAGSQEVAVDAQGRATVVALKAPPDEDGTLVQVMRLSPSGLPGTVFTLEEVPHDPPLGQCVCPELALDPSGRAVVAWQTATEEGRRVMAAFIDADGVPQPPRALSPGGESAARPSVDATPEGSFAVAWHVGGVGERVEAALLDSDGNVGESRSLTEPGEGGSYPMVAAGPEGTFHVAWNGGDNRVSTTVLDEEGFPEAIQSVSPEGVPATLSGIVIDSKGRTTIAWWHGSGLYEAKAVRLDADGTPGSVWTLQPGDQNVSGARIAVDGQDRVTAVWEDFQERIFAVRLGADGVPEAVHQISPENHLAGSPQLAAAPDGRVVVAWNHPVRFYIPEESCGVTTLEPEDDVVRAALIGSGGQLERVYDVSAYGEEAAGVQLALDPLGLPWVVWETFDGTYFCDEVGGRVLISHGFEQKDPPVEESTAPPATESPKPPPALQLAKRGVAREGRVRIRAKCSGESGQACLGSIRIISPASALLPGNARPSTRRKGTLRLARGRYRIAEGETATIELLISRFAKQLLAARSAIWVTSKAKGRGLPASTVLIRVIGSTP